MVPYTSKPVNVLNHHGIIIASFIEQHESNLDRKTVASFGEEWTKFGAIDDSDLQKIGNDYFDLVDETMLGTDAHVLDVGCGAGRWMRYLASKVGFIEGVDPSTSVFAASKELVDTPNIRITQASAENLPFADDSFDFVYSLGVLHHIPDTQRALTKCCNKIRKGGWLLIYLYYNLDNRGLVYRSIFRLSNFARSLISSCPSIVRKTLCDLIAVFIYWPSAKLGALASIISPKLPAILPLSYYRRTSFNIMRNDALDRFATPLEKRFSRMEIKRMLEDCGLHHIRFSEQEPYWHAVAQK